jgi:dienelactone hydrolase
VPVGLKGIFGRRPVGVAIVAGVLIAAPAPTAAQRRVEPVAFKSGTLTLRAVLGRPAGEGPFPVFISNHGSMTLQNASRGPWSSLVKGSLSDVLIDHGYLVLAVARRGYRGSEGTTTTYTTNRTSPDAGKTARDVFRGAEAETEDVIAALEFLAARTDVDRERIAVGGVSLGGLVSVMAAGREPRFRALVVMAGGYRQIEGGRSGGWDAAWPLVDATWKSAAPRINGPVLLLWAQNDLTIDFDTGRELEKQLRRAGKSAEMKVYPSFGDNGHSLFIHPDGYPVFVPDVVKFLDAHLKR